MTTTSGLRYDPSATFEIESIDVVYRRDGDTERLARIHRPLGEGPFPTLIDIHGGAWANGDRLMNEVSDVALAKSGMVVAAIDFRTSLNAPHPAAQEDISYGICWLKAHASEYGGTAESLGGVGWSSGGHQVMMAAMHPGKYATHPLEGAPNINDSLAYVIMGWPVIDPLARFNLAKDLKNEVMLANHLAYFGTELGMAAASPPHILAMGQPVSTPPALLVQGSADESLPRMMAERFVEAYSLAGGLIELGKYPGEPHGFLRDPGAMTDRAIEQIKSFIARQL
jgi:acetyl esterase/lipase